MIFKPTRRKQRTPMPAPPAWQYPVYFSPKRFSASDAKPYPPALPLHTPQTTLWRMEPEKPSRRKYLRRQRTFKYK